MDSRSSKPSKTLSISALSGSRSLSPVATSVHSGSSSAYHPNDIHTLDTIHYIPPPQYEPSNLLTKVSAASDGKIDYESLQKSVDSKAGRQLWLFKLPEGINAGHLDGLTIDLAASKHRVGSMKVAKKDALNGDKGKLRYNIVSAGSSMSTMPGDARNTKAGLQVSKALKEGEKSHLVDVYDALDTNAIPTSEIGGHMDNLQAFVPSSRCSSGAGSRGLVLASPLPISRKFQFVLQAEDPAPLSSSGPNAALSSSSSAEQVSNKPLQADPSEYRNRGRRIRRLQGYFAPSGSLYDKEKAAQSALLGSATSSKDAATSTNKRKKAGRAAEEEEADISTASPAKEKSKKTRKFESATKAGETLRTMP